MLVCMRKCVGLCSSSNSILCRRRVLNLHVHIDVLYISSTPADSSHICLPGADKQNNKQQDVHELTITYQ
jgi:hypothetical protein